MEQIISWFDRNIGSNGSELEWYWRLLIVAVVVLVAYLVDYLFSHIVVPSVRRITSKTTTKVDDVLLSDKVVHAFSNIIPPIILTFALPFVTKGTFEEIISRLTFVYIIICVTRFLCYLVTALFEAFLTKGEESGKDQLRLKSLKGLIQTIQIVIILVAAIWVVSVFIGKSPAYLISGLGAMAAVLMLVFQDSIKGLVASIQLMFNDMVSVGEWIAMPSRNIDGVVIEITLTTVKIRNWDNTILTVPPYALLTETFQNWRGMQESGGRRLNPEIHVDMYSVHFLTEAEIREFRQRGFMSDSVKIGDMTNLEIFRQQMLNHLQTSPDFNHNMTCMVRQLPAGSEGIPIQFYAFTKTKEWELYEGVKSRLVEYALASLREFGLNAYQRSSGKFSGTK